MKLKKVFFLILGCLCLGLGCVGIALPILPTVPFFLATLFFFANSSKWFHDWFLGTALYQKHLESFVQKRGMTAKNKAAIICSITLVIGLGFCMMSNVPVGRIILVVVWVCHLVYFLFGVKTLSDKNLEKKNIKTDV